MLPADGPEWSSKTFDGYGSEHTTHVHTYLTTVLRRMQAQKYHALINLKSRRAIPRYAPNIRNLMSTNEYILLHRKEL